MHCIDRDIGKGCDMSTSIRPLQAGDRAPDFDLPAVNREGSVSLADYRTKGPVLVVLVRGLHCAFCRRHLARLAATQEKLTREGVATVAIVNTRAERARQYFQYRPTNVELATDPDAQTHHAFGLPAFEVLPDSTDPRELHWPQTYTYAELHKAPLHLDGLPERMTLIDANAALDAKEGFEPKPADEESATKHGSQLAGQFIIDTSGTIRWTFIEALDSPNLVGYWPSDEEIIAAARGALH
jgi:peroxiredoxin